MHNTSKTFLATFPLKFDFFVCHRFENQSDIFNHQYDGLLDKNASKNQENV